MSENEPSQPDPSAVPEAPQTPGAEELAELRSKAQERDALMDRLKRVTADYMNSQKRMEREMQERSDHAIQHFARELLNPSDDLARAINVAHVQKADERLLKGLELVEKHLLECFRRHGLTPIEAQPGQPFNADIHEAVSVIRTGEFEPNTIVQQVQKGFRLHSRLLRPARVVVSAAPQGVEETEEPSDEDTEEMDASRD